MVGTLDPQLLRNDFKPACTDASLGSEVGTSKLTAGGEAVSTNARGSALALSAEAQSKPDSQSVGAVTPPPLTKIKAAGEAGNVRCVEAPPAFGLNTIVRLTGLAVGPWTTARSPEDPAE